jgi:hypothetical protein
MCGSPSSWNRLLDKRLNPDSVKSSLGGPRSGDGWPLRASPAAAHSNIFPSVQALERGKDHGDE